MAKKDFLDLVDIVGQYIQLTPEGTAHFLGKCPFCASQEESLILSKDTQFWHCLSCGVNGDRYDFVAKSEKIGRAEAILMVGHHTNSGEPFPHARFKPAAATPAPAPAAAPAPPAPKPAEPPKAQAAAAAPGAPAGGAGQGLSVPFLEFRNIIPSYQGATLLDDMAKVILGDSESSYSADLAAIGGMLAPSLVRAGTLLAKWGMDPVVPATLTLASEDLAILVHRFGSADNARLLVVRLANPADAPVARRLVASASAKLT